jgi:phage terminase large subunit-like protein
MGFDCYEYHPDKPAGSGLKMIRHAQGARGMHTDKTLWMPRSFNTTCDAILDGRLTIERNGLTMYCASNVALKSDAHGNQRIGKKRTRSHQDGIVALVMGIGAVLRASAKAEIRIDLGQRHRAHQG